jgi:hypothetical protein
MGFLSRLFFLQDDAGETLFETERDANVAVFAGCEAALGTYQIPSPADQTARPG